MTLWIIFAAMTAVACTLLLRPFQSSTDTQSKTLSPTDVYKDQLKELDRDLKEDLITCDEMEAAKTEISRRILDAEAKSGKSYISRLHSGIHKKIVLALLISVPAVSLPIYLWVGQPHFKAITVAEFNRAQQKKMPSLEQLILRVESHLKKNPDDIKGWQVLARVYTNIGRQDDAARAAANIKRIREKTENIRNLPEDERKLMIKSMVAGLHARLKTDGGDIDSWLRLLRSYMVLGQKEDAQTSYLEAKKALSNDKGALKRLTEFAMQFGLVRR